MPNGSSKRNDFAGVEEGEGGAFTEFAYRYYSADIMRFAARLLVTSSLSLALYYPGSCVYNFRGFFFSSCARNKLKCHQAPMLTEREVFASDSEMSDFFLTFFFSRS